MTDQYLTRSKAFEASDDVGRNASGNPTLGDVIAQRYDRRDILRGALGVVAIAATVSPLAIAAAEKAHAADGTRFSFKEVAAGVDEKHYVAEGYDADILMRWGDPVLPDAPAFDPMKQTAAAQKLQFGYNSDYIGYIPMPGAANPSHHGLLVVNHEYTNEELMFPGLGRQDAKNASFAKMTKELSDIEMAAHGGAVIEIKRENGKWRVVDGSRRQYADGNFRPRRRRSAHADEGGSDGPQRARHDQQLCRGHHAMGHLAHL
jgi:secreted PhoX family phosphatase